MHSLVHFDRARIELELAYSVDEVKQIRDKARCEERESAIRLAEMTNEEERVRIVRGDFREALREPLIQTGSVDLIVTDPPYGKAHLPLWKDLSRFAARALKPGRILVTYSGNYYLPEVMRLVGEHLQYVWTAVVMNGTPPDTVFPRKIMTCWKPLLLFSHGDYLPPLKGEWFKDRIEGDGRNKAFHNWQQGVAFDRLDLDAWIDQYKNRNGRPGKAMGGKPPWDQRFHQGSENVEKHGTFGKQSEVTEFEKALERTTSRKRKDT